VLVVTLSFTGSLVTQRFGKKNFMVMSGTSLSVVLMLLGSFYLLEYDESSPSESNIGEVRTSVWHGIIAMLFLYRSNVAFGYAPNLFGYVSDVCPEHIVSYAKIAYWFFVCIVGFTFL
jgi:hypothetical protein